MTKTKTFSIPDQDAEAIASALKKLREVDLWSESRVIVEAIREYAKNHLPGNPGLPLDHWTRGLPFNQAAQEKLVLPKGARDQDCEACKGSGQIDGRECEVCAGKGRVYYYSRRSPVAWSSITTNDGMQEYGESSKRCLKEVCPLAFRNSRNRFS